jgi:hypothetical protein
MSYSGKKDKDKDKGKGKGKQNFKNKETKRKGEKSSEETRIPIGEVESLGWQDGDAGDDVLANEVIINTPPINVTDAERACDSTVYFIDKDDAGGHECYLCGKPLNQSYPLEYLRSTSNAMLHGRNNIPDPEMTLNGWQHWRASAVIKLGCRHMFHHGCLDNYFKRNILSPSNQELTRYLDDHNTDEDVGSLFRYEEQKINCPRCADVPQDTMCVTAYDEIMVDNFIGIESPQTSLQVPDHVRNYNVNASEMYQNETYLGQNIVRDNNGCLPGGECVLSGGKGKKTKKKGKKTKKKGKKTKKKGKKTKKKGKKNKKKTKRIYKKN